MSDNWQPEDEWSEADQVAPDIEQDEEESSFLKPLPDDGVDRCTRRDGLGGRGRGGSGRRQSLWGGGGPSIHYINNLFFL